MVFFFLGIRFTAFVNMQSTYIPPKEVKPKKKKRNKRWRNIRYPSLSASLLCCHFVSAGLLIIARVVNSKLNFLVRKDMVLLITLNTVGRWNHSDILLSTSVQTHHHLPSQTVSTLPRYHDLFLLLSTLVWDLSCLGVFPDVYLSV